MPLYKRAVYFVLVFRALPALWSANYNIVLLYPTFPLINPSTYITFIALMRKNKLITTTTAAVRIC